MIAVMQDISLLNDNEMQKERKYEMRDIFALGSAFFAGLTSILAKIGIKKTDSTLATGASWLCYYKALHDGLASVVVPIDKLSIVVTIVFSYFVFGERLSKKAMTGLLAIIAGTLVMLI